MIAFLITAGVAAYAFIGGAFGWAFYLNRKAACSDCNHSSGKGYCIDMHEMPGVIAGALWPLALPAFGGGMLANRFANSEERAQVKAKRKEREHEHRLAEVEAERELVREQKERTLADIKFLAENGIHAEVPGLYDGGVQ
jgi:hypothetical protein